MAPIVEEESTRQSCQQSGESGVPLNDILNHLTSVVQQLSVSVERLATRDVPQVRSPNDSNDGERNLGNEEDSDKESVSGFQTPYATRSSRNDPSNGALGDVAPPPQMVIEHINTVHPPKFNGDRARARSWLSEYESIMDANSVADSKKVTKARAFMTEFGRKWYNVTLDRIPNLTWKGFKRQFILDFCGPDAIAQLRKQLDATTQTSGEHPNEYAVRVLDLCIELNPKMSSEERVERILRGLKTHTRNILACIKPDEDWELQELLNLLAAQRVDQRSEKSQKPADQDDQRSKSPKRSREPKPKNLETWICFNCNEKGHEIDSCPKAKDEALIAARTSEYRAKRAATKAKQVASVSNPVVKAVETSRLPCDDDPKLHLKVDVNGIMVEGRIDTGADMTVISSDVAKKLKLNLLPWKSGPLTSANKSPLTIQGMAPVLATIDYVSKPILVVVIPKESLTQILWGNDLLHAFNMKLDFSRNTAQVSAETATIDVDSRAANNVETQDLPHPLNQVKIGELSKDNERRLSESLIEFGDVFSRSEEDIGRTSLIKHRIILTSDVPVYKRRYQVPYKHLPKMESIIERMKESGVIRDSVSPYAAPGFLVDKEGGKDKRLVADYRHLNALTVPDRTPMPHPEDVFSLLAGMKVFAKLDITAMFNQIAVDERDVAKTAMTTHFGLFEFVTMPFGLKNAPATAVRLMREVLRGLDERICYVYFDDIIIFAQDEQQLIERCIEVLRRLRTHNLKLKPSKCLFGEIEVSFLGHVISSRGVDVDPKRIIHVKRFPVPKNPSDVRSFHGLCSYNRKFIKDFAKIAKPLTGLMNVKPTEFVWTAEAQVAFESLRDALTSAPTLVHFNPEAEHELRTDASSYAIGAVLYQKHQDPNQTGVVLYHSKTLNQAQRNYSATERELLAAFNAITTLKHYLLGKRFILVTDHAALSLLRSQKDPHNRLARWIAQLMPFDFEVRYKSGQTHKDADCLSRLTNRELGDEEEPVDVDDLIDPSDVACSSEFIRAICSVTSQEPAEVASQTSDRDTRLNLADTEKEQREDQYCNRIIEVLEDATLSDEEKDERAYGFAIFHGKLYRRWPDGRNALVVPARRRAAVLLSCHDSPLGGHFGFTKTYSQIRERFYWPKMRRDVKRHVQSCPGCQLRKASTTRRQGLTIPLPIAEDVFDTVGLDLIVKLPKSRDGFNTLMVCTDNLSKFAIVVPLKNELGQTIRHAFLNHVVTKYGCPKLVITDRGCNLTNPQQKDFFDLFGIKRQMTSPYHPQSNGQTERFNRTLAASLTIFVERNQTDWPDFVQAITFAYNISEHTVTRAAPYELVFGRRPRIPIENILGRDDVVDPLNPPGSKSSEALKIMKKLIAESQLANKRRLDKRLAECTFGVGDMVVVQRTTRIPGASHKLSFHYCGPYKIVRKVNDILFELEGCPKSAKLSSYIIHASQLRKFIGRSDDVVDDLVDPTFVAREMIEIRDVSDETETASEAEFEPGSLPPALSPHPAEVPIQPVCEPESNT